MRHAAVLAALGPLGRVGLKLVPKKSGPVALTLHDVAPAHMGWMKDIVGFLGERWGFIRPADVIAATETVGQEAHGRRHGGVLLTFDDGFLSGRKIAEEVLSESNVKALFFVPEKFIGLGVEDARRFVQERYFGHRRLDGMADSHGAAMGLEDLAWLQAQGHEIGAHTRTHPAMSTLSEQEQRVEIVGSADRLEKRLGRELRFFAYPYGSLRAVDESAVRLAEGRFSRAFSNVRGGLLESPSRHFLFRQNLVPGMPSWLVEAVVEGRLDWRHASARREAGIRFRVPGQS